MKILGMDMIPDHSTIDRFIHSNHDAIADIMRLRILGSLIGIRYFRREQQAG